ncbi:unnamed protein product, partial [Ceratitis capitata]
DFRMLCKLVYPGHRSRAFNFATWLNCMQTCNQQCQKSKMVQQGKKNQQQQRHIIGNGNNSKGSDRNEIHVHRL